MSTPKRYFPEQQAWCLLPSGRWTTVITAKVNCFMGLSAWPDGHWSVSQAGNYLADGKVVKPFGADLLQAAMEEAWDKAMELRRTPATT
jgi:hypothetical protein